MNMDVACADTPDKGLYYIACGQDEVCLSFDKWDFFRLNIYKLKMNYISCHLIVTRLSKTYHKYYYLQYCTIYETTGFVGDVKDEVRIS